MISTVQNFQIEGKNYNIDLAAIPELSEKSRHILSAFNPNLPPSIDTVRFIKNRIERIEEAQRIFNQANNGIKSKISALLKGMFLAVLVYQSVFSSIYGEDFEILALALPAEVIYVGLATHFYFKACGKIEQLEKRDPEYSPNTRLDCKKLFPVIVSTLGGGIVMPIYEAFTQKKRIEKIIEKEKKLIEEQMNSQKEKDSELIAWAFKFYRNNFSEIMIKLNEVISDATKTLVDISRSQEKFTVRDISLRESISYYSIAREDLVQMINFYRQLNPVVGTLECEQEPCGQFPQDSSTTPLLLDINYV